MKTRSHWCRSVINFFLEWHIMCTAAKGQQHHSPPKDDEDEEHEEHEAAQDASCEVQRLLQQTRMRHTRAPIAMATSLCERTSGSATPVDVVSTSSAFSILIWSFRLMHRFTNTADSHSVACPKVVKTHDSLAVPRAQIYCSISQRDCLDSHCYQRLMSGTDSPH